MQTKNGGVLRNLEKNFQCQKPEIIEIIKL